MKLRTLALWTAVALGGEALPGLRPADRFEYRVFEQRERLLAKRSPQYRLNGHLYFGVDERHDLQQLPQHRHDPEQCFNLQCQLLQHQYRRERRQLCQYDRRQHFNRRF